MQDSSRGLCRIGVYDAIFRGAKAEGFIEAVLSYAQRLLSGTYGSRKAKQIAQKLVFGYFDHDRSLTAEELILTGLEIDVVTLEEQGLLDTMASNLPDAICVGSLTPLNFPYRPGTILPSRGKEPEGPVPFLEVDPVFKETEAS